MREHRRLREHGVNSLGKALTRLTPGLRRLLGDENRSAFEPARA